MTVPRWKRQLNRLDSSLRRRVSRQENGEFVGVLYEDLLCRPPDPGALSEPYREARCSACCAAAASRERLRSVASAEYRAVARERERRDWLRDAPAPSTRRSLAPEASARDLARAHDALQRPSPVRDVRIRGLDVAPRERRHMDPATWRSLLPLLREAHHVGLHGAGEPLLYPFLDDLLVGLGAGPRSSASTRTAICWASTSRAGSSSEVWGGSPFRSTPRRRRPTSGSGAEGTSRHSFRGSGRSGRPATGPVRARPRIEINMTLMRMNLDGGAGLRGPRGANRRGRGHVPGDAARRGTSAWSLPTGGSSTIAKRSCDREAAGTRSSARPGGGRSRTGSGSAARSSIHGGRRRASGPSPRPRRCDPRPRARARGTRSSSTSQGNAFVCCVHKSNGVVLGTRPRDSVEEIWNGRRARLVREAMFAAAAPACCAGCYRTS